MPDSNGPSDIDMVPVDSGMLCIIDPCYLVSDSDSVESPTSEWYSAVVEANLADDANGALARVKPPYSGRAHGLVFSAGGDGTYDVTVQRDDSGRPVRVIIDLQTWTEE